MGSSPSIQPASPTIKKQKSKVYVPSKPKQPQQPPKPLIAEVAVKNIQMSQQISKQNTAQIEAIKRQYLIEFQNRFLLKVLNKQIRLTFKPVQQTLDLLSSSLHESSLKSLDKRCSNDLKMYRQICEIKMKCLLTQHIKNIKQNQQSFQRIKQTIKNEFSQIITQLIAQIEGKTNIWYSLNLPKKQKIRNFINFLHQQGVDSSHFDIIKEQESLIYEM